jgi:hypothetical protein
LLFLKGRDATLDAHLSYPYNIKGLRSDETQRGTSGSLMR